jgi:hypothetical protein
LNCPSCSRPLAEGATECASCGIVLAKWKPQQQRPRTHAGTTPVASSPAPAKSSPWVFILIAIVAIAAGSVWFFRGRSSDAETDAPILRKGSGEVEARAVASTHPEFDLVLEMPGSPGGLASNGREMVVGNRTKPWGAIRVRRDREHYIAKQVAMIEPRNRQQMNVSTLTWNGKNFVGITTGSWFGKTTDDVFTIHDPETLQVLETKVAPPLLGGLAWDGTSYWASTRKNTVDSSEEAFFYKLDRDFNVVGKTTPPAVGCQGLAWDGSRLWFVDVFNDALYVLDVSGAEPRVVHTQPMPMDYLSGVTWHDDAIWITDYDDNRLRRVAEVTRAAWLGTQPRPTLARASALTPAAGGESVEELRRKLRSESWSERMSAEMKLDQLGAPIDYARDQNNFVDRKPDDTEDIDWAIELRDNAVWLVSSRIWFGHDLFANRTQSPSMVTVPVFARYTFTTKQPDGTETEKQFEATAGDNTLLDVRLADATANGEYQVSLFIHVQYVDAAGTGKILNNSAGFLEVRK